MFFKRSFHERYKLEVGRFFKKEHSHISLQDEIDFWVLWACTNKNDLVTLTPSTKSPTLVKNTKQQEERKGS